MMEANANRYKSQYETFMETYNDFMAKYSEMEAMIGPLKAQALRDRNTHLRTLKEKEKFKIY